MSGYSPLSGAPGVLIDASVHRHSERGDAVVDLRYLGLPEDLLAAGIATAETLVPFTSTTKHTPRFDPAGNRVYVSRHFVVRKGQVMQKVTLRYPLELPLDKAVLLRGVLEILRKQGRQAREESERQAACEGSYSGSVAMKESPTPAPHGLRLVVDNTRETEPA